MFLLNLVQWFYSQKDKTNWGRKDIIILYVIFKIIYKLFHSNRILKSNDSEKHPDGQYVKITYTFWFPFCIVFYIILSGYEFIFETWSKVPINWNGGNMDL